MRPSPATRRLRGADPLTVEVEVPGLVNRPIGQIAAGTLADLLSLTELDDLASGIRVRIKGFGERVGREVSDMPVATLDELVEGLKALPADEVPTSLRLLLAEEAGRRTGEAKASLESLSEGWEASEPVEFAFGEPRVKARQMQEGSRRKEAVKGRQARPAEPGSKKRSRTPRASRPAETTDPKQTAWVRQLVLERLTSTGGAGLLEPVLLAAIVHRSRDRFPNLSNRDVLAVLKQMSSNGEVRHSARRWLAAGR